MLSNRAGGGGRYGDPHDRASEAVREYVLEGYVSREALREEYSIVETEAGDVNHGATEDLQ